MCVPSYSPGKLRIRPSLHEFSSYVLDEAVVHLSFGSNHHRAASELAVIECDKQASAIVEIILPFNSNGKWTPVESCQREEVSR